MVTIRKPWKSHTKKAGNLYIIETSTYKWTFFPSPSEVLLKVFTSES